MSSPDKESILFSVTVRKSKYYAYPRGVDPRSGTVNVDNKI